MRLRRTRPADQEYHSPRQFLIASIIERTTLTPSDDNALLCTGV